MVTKPSYPRNDFRPFWIYLIPAEGEAQPLANGWADADQALDFGIDEARKRYRCAVEVVVVERTSREAVRNQIV